MNEKQPTLTKTFRAQWAVMTFYERFEQGIALVLSAVIAVIIVVSLLQLMSIVFTLLILDAFNPLDHKVFQTVFAMIMTLLIAMEFKHSIVRVAQITTDHLSVPRRSGHRARAAASKSPRAPA